MASSFQSGFTQRWYKHIEILAVGGSKDGAFFARTPSDGVDRLFRTEIDAPNLLASQKLPYTDIAILTAVSGLHVL